MALRIGFNSGVNEGGPRLERTVCPKESVRFGLAPDRSSSWMIGSVLGRRSARARLQATWSADQR
jgi:hypothetical protein